MENIKNVTTKNIEEIRATYAEYQQTQGHKPCPGCIYDAIFNEFNMVNHPCKKCNLGIEAECPDAEYSNRKVSILDLLDMVNASVPEVKA